MLSKRIIACLDVRSGHVVKGVNFEGLRSAGDPSELARRYNREGIDELVILDITATIEGRGPMLDLVERAAAELSIPFTVGGGVSGLEDARSLLRAGADKVAVNRAAVDDPSILTALADEFGAQAVPAGTDAAYGDPLPDGPRQRLLDDTRVPGDIRQQPVAQPEKQCRGGEIDHDGDPGQRGNQRAPPRAMPRRIALGPAVFAAVFARLDAGFVQGYGVRSMRPRHNRYNEDRR